MTKPPVAVITGAAGGIGEALVRGFRANGWRVAAVGGHSPIAESAADAVFTLDLAALGDSEDGARELAAKVRAHFGDAPVSALINNAATQRLGKTGSISWDDWRVTLAVNLSAPFALARAFLPDLEAAGGCILNIGSVHAQATKPEFVAYATSKAALHGLTRALAVDLGPRVRVVCLAPAAISTPMLLDGFKDREAAFARLEAFHPAGRIGAPEEVCEAALFLVSPAARFAHGSTFYLDGGILARLHDPA
ncbi:MAG: SDR family oxidoreductase [Maricaulaceae bacterium]|jgi:NAD(P)-dependent dehydrogenase (short-subunit alcohol dehydrogenase family)